eukprot:jgi/Botrbrau1/2126/Bobra.0093s0033.1
MARLLGLQTLQRVRRMGISVFHRSFVIPGELASMASPSGEPPLAEGKMVCSSHIIMARQAYTGRNFSADAKTTEEHGGVLDKLRGAAGKGTPDAVLEVIDGHGSEFGEAEVEEALQQLSTLAKEWSAEDKKSLHGAPGLQALIDMVILGRNRFQTRQLTNILQLAADLALDDQALLDRVSQTLISSVEKMPPNELTQMATSLMRLDHSPSVVLFDAIQKRIVDISDSVSTEEKSALEKSFSKLGYNHDAITKEVS